MYDKYWTQAWHLWLCVFCWPYQMNFLPSINFIIIIIIAVVIVVIIRNSSITIIIVIVVIVIIVIVVIVIIVFVVNDINTEMYILPVIRKNTCMSRT